MKERLLGTSGFPLGGSCQRPRPLTDEGKACGSCLLRVSNGKPVPHPALRGHLPPRGKALIDQYPIPICRFAAFRARDKISAESFFMWKFPLYVQIKLPRRESCAVVIIQGWKDKIKCRNEMTSVCVSLCVGRGALTPPQASATDRKRSGSSGGGMRACRPTYSYPSSCSL